MTDLYIFSPFLSSIPMSLFFINFSYLIWSRKRWCFLPTSIYIFLILPTPLSFSIFSCSFVELWKEGKATAFYLGQVENGGLWQ